jgi:uncharacterized protein (DUF58 family)
MDEQEQVLFDRFEQDTNHQFLIKLTAGMAKISWLLVAVGIILISAKSTKFGYLILIVALVLLFLSFCVGIGADRVRRRIQKRVDRELQQ